MDLQFFLNSPYRAAILIYLGIINIAAFFAYGLDKWKATQNQWRIPEKTLLGLAGIGGSAGAYLGMKVFHHKTRHKIFSIGIPVILVVHVVLLSMIFSQS